MDFEENLQSEDKAVFDAIECELKRQQNQIELIASENIVSNAVLEAQGSIMTNKYAEGYPAHRYYGGCECVDVVENLRLNGLKSCLTRSLPMFSRIREVRPIRLFMLRC